MKHIIIGTAGHVDHGKTRLTLALTGKDTDRLKEEKERGITIENGYANLTLTGDMAASIIDVPGHERFVKNMIAGATGIDMVLLCIAADEGIMPQTREHLDILTLLDIRKGIVVLTKADLVDEEWLEVMQAEIREELKGTFLEHAPMVSVSAQSGFGMEELKATIVREVEETDSKRRDRPFRMPIDRIFTVKGFGTVVTGTLVDGTVRPNDLGVIYPTGQQVRIREIQNHDVTVDRAEAGMRTAMNLAGVEKKELVRGYTIASPESMIMTKCIDVRVKITVSCEFIITHNSQLHFYHGAQESVCKIRLLENDELGPEDEAYAQLMFEEPVAVRNGDLFILRFFSPVITIGGGTILDAAAKRHSRNRKEILEKMGHLTDTSPKERLLAVISSERRELWDIKKLAEHENISVPEMTERVRELFDSEYVIFPETEEFDENRKFLATTVAEDIYNDVEDRLHEFHRANPLKDGMNQSELRKSLPFTGKADCDRVLSWYESRGNLRIADGEIALADFEVVLTEEQKKLQDRILAFYEEAGTKAPDNKVVNEAFAGYGSVYEMIAERLRKEGVLVALSPDSTVLRKYEQQTLAVFKELQETREQVTLAELKEAMDFSRKYSQLYLEYWDRTAVTRRVGDAHILRNKDNLL